jgi:hypothetical protein
MTAQRTEALTVHHGERQPGFEVDDVARPSSPPELCAMQRERAPRPHRLGREGGETTRFRIRNANDLAGPTLRS